MLSHHGIIFAGKRKTTKDERGDKANWHFVSNRGGPVICFAFTFTRVIHRNDCSLIGRMVGVRDGTRELNDGTQ